MPFSIKKIHFGSIPQMLLAGLISGIFIYSIFQPAIANFILGFLIGLQSYLYISSFERIIKPRLSKRNFFLALITSTLAYALLIILAVFVSLIIISEFRVMSVLKNFKEILLSEAMIYGITFGLTLSFIFNSLSMFEMLLGKHFLFKLFTGKYHTPFEEERVFMFLDLKGSTAIAEKLGHREFLKMLNDFFYDVSIAVTETKGEIYKYVGDEAIITWKMKKVVGKPLPLNCFFMINKIVEDNRANYIKRYGLVPEFKAGLHGGTVVTGEMGYIKKEIAFLGDVLNTTARIEVLCNQLNKCLLVSDTLIKTMNIKDDYNIEPVGEQVLRGKQKAIAISSVTLNRDFQIAS